MKNNNGFTLIELIAVIAITGIVSLMMIPSLNNMLSTNSTRQCEYYAKAMRTAAKSYIQKEGPDIKEANNGSYPSTYIISLNDLINSGYMEIYKDDRTKINGANTATPIIDPVVTVSLIILVKHKDISVRMFGFTLQIDH